MWWTLLAALTAHAEEPPEQVEEVVVWGDAFARWEHRWLVETDILFANLMRLPAELNTESRLNRLQVRTVLDCDKDVKLIGSNWEVNCTVEDIGLVAMIQRKGRDDLRVLQEADAALTGAKLQLQVSPQGGVPNVDVEGLSTRNSRDRERLEVYRQILSRVILPFHLGLPNVIHSGAKWYETDSRLMSMPSPYASGGSSKIAHYMNAYEGHMLVQSTGEGMLRPDVGVDGFQLRDDGIVEARDPAVDSFMVAMTGVAVFDIDTGIMSERVWAVEGGLTASSPNVLKGLRYGHQGRLKLLGQQEAPEVGATYVARADASEEGTAPIWAPLKF